MIMNNFPSEVIHAFLLAGGLGTLVTASEPWPVYISHLPDGEGDPDDAICVYDTDPVLNGRNMDGQLTERPGIQIIVRALKYVDGYTKSKAIAEALNNVYKDAVVIGATNYTLHNVSRISGVIAMGNEGGMKRREMFSTNFLLTVKQDSI